MLISLAYTATGGAEFGPPPLRVKAHTNRLFSLIFGKEGNRDETRRIGTGTGRGHPYIGIAQYIFWRIPDIAQFNPV